MFGYASLVSSISALMTFTSFTSSTRPLGHELLVMTLSHPSRSGILLQGLPFAPETFTSMNVLWELTGHHWQTVSFAVVAWYVNASMISNPRNRGFHPLPPRSTAHTAAPHSP